MDSVLQANCRLVDNLTFSPVITLNQNALVISLKVIALWVLIFFLIQTYLLMLRTGNRVTWLGAAWRDLKRVFSKIFSRFFVFRSNNCLSANRLLVDVPGEVGWRQSHLLIFIRMWSKNDFAGTGFFRILFPSTIKSLQSRLKISPLKCSWSWSAPPPDTWEKHASILPQPCFPPVSGADDTGAVARNNDDEKIAELWIRRKEWTLLANLGGFLELILLPIYIFRANTFTYFYFTSWYFYSYFLVKLENAFKNHLATVAPCARQGKLAEFHLTIKGIVHIFHLFDYIWNCLVNSVHLCLNMRGL